VLNRHFVYCRRQYGYIREPRRLAHISSHPGELWEAIGNWEAIGARRQFLNNAVVGDGQIDHLRECYLIMPGPRKGMGCRMSLVSSQQDCPNELETMCRVLRLVADNRSSQIEGRCSAVNQQSNGRKNRDVNVMCRPLLDPLFPRKTR
jgi:hypothetical protein